MSNFSPTFRPKVLATAVGVIAILGSTGCDATKKTTLTTPQNVSVPVDESQTREGDRTSESGEMRDGDRSGVANEMDARAGMHSEMSGHRDAGRAMGSSAGHMSGDKMGMGGDKMSNDQAPADPPMKDNR